MLGVLYYDEYALLDLGENVSFVASFLANKFHVCPKFLHEPYEVSNLIGESIIAQKVYRGCPMSILLKVVFVT